MATIEIAKDGPLIIKGVKELKKSNGENIEVKDVIHLCRCGSSGNKPFCDGTHRKTGFRDEKN